MSLGDNLTDAKAFSGLCDETLTRLVESESYIVTTKDENIYVLSALDTIQTEAKRMQARAISRAAQTAINGVESLRDTKNQVRNLRDLMHLVRQYQTGLDEILPAQEPSKRSVNSVQDDVVEFETARQTLKSVIKHAGAEGDIEALSRLANWRPHLPDIITFDQLMPALSDETLRAARAHGKSVSVSYAADEIVLERRLYHNLSETLSVVTSWLVESIIERPEHRLAQGLAQSSHIAITARRVDGHLDILLSCNGELSDVAKAKLSNIKMPEEQTGLLSCSTAQGFVRVDLKGILLPSNLSVRKDFGAYASEHGA